MKISISIEFDTDDTKDLAVLNCLNESIRTSYGSTSETKITGDTYEKAWLQCSWEIITFAVTVLKINDGTSSKGTYAIFKRLLDPNSTELCGTLTERAISSRVGRTAVVCKKIGNFRLMEVAVRRKDLPKRVHVDNDAKTALLKLLRGDWGKEFNAHLVERCLDEQDFTTM